MEITFTASPPNNVCLSDTYEGTLVFNWTSPIQKCTSISYQISSDCGSCPETTSTTTVNCSVGAITHEASNCTFSVRSVVCGRTGEANRPIIVTLKGMVLRGVPRGVLRVLEHPHQIEESKLYLIEQLAREEATRTATDL